MKKLKACRLLFFPVMLLLLAACAAQHRTSASIEKVAREKLETAGQVLLVKENRFLFWTSPSVCAMERQNGVWTEVFVPMPAVIGRNGFAPLHEKREGDGRTPSGLYRLGTVFGYAESVETRMPYRQALVNDLWVDDPGAPDYNRWVKLHETKAASYEKMKRDDDQYKYGLVIEYNTHPVITGLGSAIFLHVREKRGAPTSGCIALSEEDLLKILGWLHPAAAPVIWINPDEDETGLYPLDVLQCPSRQCQPIASEGNRACF